MVRANIVSIVGESGVGKTTLMKTLIDSDETFRMLPSPTTRQPRISDLPNEYSYLTAEEFEELKAADRFLWVTDKAGNAGDLYAKDKEDVRAAIADPDHVYLNALIPDYARLLAEKYGRVAVRTIFLESPGQEELRQRMLNRGDSPGIVRQRQEKEQAESWSNRLQGIEGLVIITAQELLARSVAVKAVI